MFQAKVLLASPVVSLTCAFGAVMSYQVSAFSNQNVLTETCLLIAETCSSVQECDATEAS